MYALRSPESAALPIREKNSQLITGNSNIKYFNLVYTFKPHPYSIIIYKSVRPAYLNIPIPDANSPFLEKFNGILTFLIHPFFHQLTMRTTGA